VFAWGLSHNRGLADQEGEMSERRLPFSIFVLSLFVIIFPLFVIIFLDFSNSIYSVFGLQAIISLLPFWEKNKIDVNEI